MSNRFLVKAGACLVPMILVIDLNNYRRFFKRNIGLHLHDEYSINKNYFTNFDFFSLINEKISISGCRNFFNRSNDHFIDEFRNALFHRDDSFLIRLIKDNKELLNERHPYGWAAIHIAAAYKRSDIIRILLENGADPNLIDNYSTPISGNNESGGMITINSLSLDAVRTRSDNFPDELYPLGNFAGFTALHYSAFLNDQETAKLLINNGANTSIKNADGYTPIDICLDDKMKEFLVNHELKRSEEEKKKRIEERKLYPIEKRFQEKIVGQVDAIKSISSAIIRKENGWVDEDKPLVFLFLGSSGVGKTEMGKQIAFYLLNDSKKLIRLDMSEYQEKHEVSKMIGSPPGYVGHDDGGQLTKLLKENPDAVVLFDEIEKAHPDVLTIMLQLFDEGRLTDGKGNTIECKNAIFIMTSNLASELIAHHASVLRSKNPNIDEKDFKFSRKFKENQIYPILKKHFKRDEFLGRISEVVYFLPFSKNELSILAKKELDIWAEKANKRHSIILTWTDRIPEKIAEGYNIHYGARSIKHEVEKKIIAPIARMHELGQIKSNDIIKIDFFENSDKEQTESNQTDKPDNIYEFYVSKSGENGKSIWSKILGYVPAIYGS